MSRTALALRLALLVALVSLLASFAAGAPWGPI